MSITRWKMAAVRLRNFRLVLGFLSLAICICPAFGQSKYAKIKNGVGNILVGEVLPYDDDEGYKNVVLDSVKLSQMSKWENFYFRAYLGSKIMDIEHDIRVLAWHIEGVGKRAEQFNREAGGNFILTVDKKDDSSEYGERSEWSRQYPDFNAAPKLSLGKFIKALDTEHKITLERYLLDYDYAKPSTFEYRRTQDDIGDELVFSPATFKEWKDKYGLTSLVVTLDAYSFLNGGDITEGENKKTLEVNSDGDLEEKEHLSSIKTYTRWEGKNHLATGKFTIVLD
jgi:hypothetical protein